MTSNYKIIFFGTSEFAREILRGLLSAGYEIQALVTQPDKMIGRHQILTPPPTKEVAQEYKIPILQPEKIKNNSESINQIKELSPDLIITAAYGQIIPKKILTLPKFGAINIHASLLPKFRGASPIQAAILAAEEEVGVTIMLMDEELDHGPIIGNSKFKIQNSKFTAEELSNELAKIGIKLLIEILPEWLAGAIKPAEQNHSQATYTRILTRENGRIDWSKSAEEIERQIRAFTPWPGTWTTWEGKIFKIFEAEILETKNSYKFGEVFKYNNFLAVKCEKNALIIKKLQLEGKKEMSQEEFLNGYPKIISSILK
jgi:methionyl-tRNA formyltransferase